jgi:xylulokinase
MMFPTAEECKRTGKLLDNDRRPRYTGAEQKVSWRKRSDIMSAEYVAGIDAGTTGAKVTVFDTEGKVVSSAYREYPCLFPQPGWMEQDVELVWKKTCEAAREALARPGIDPRRVRSLGLSSQRGTFLPIDRSGAPLMNSLVHSDLRAQAETEWVTREIGAERYHQITGVMPSAMWSYPKIKWIMDNRPDVFEKTALFVNGQEYFLRRLGAETLSTDPASITLNGMLDVDALCWSGELLRKIGLPADKLPPMGTPARQVGKISRAASAETGFAEGMPIAIGAGDQQCAAVGAGIVREGMAEITIGTTMVMVAHIDARREDPGKKVLVGGSGIPRAWDMEGLMAVAGSALRWWRDTNAAAEKEEAGRRGVDPYELITAQAAQSPAGSKGLLFFPCFLGILTPKYYDYASGGFLGLTFAHDRKDMARAILEGVAYEVKMVIDAMEEVLGRPFEALRLSGGGARSPLWSQVQADIYGRTVERLEVSECTTLGAAILGAVGCGVFDSVQGAVGRMVHRRDAIEPDMANHALYRELYAAFEGAFDALRDSGVYQKISGFQRAHG